MRTTYDEKADAAHICPEHPLAPGAAKETAQVDEHVILDFDEKRKLLGADILDASKILGKKALLEAEHI